MYKKTCCASNCSIIEKILLKRVVFSDFICTFAMSFRVLFVFKCDTKKSGISDIAKFLATFGYLGVYKNY